MTTVASKVSLIPFESTLAGFHPINRVLVGRAIALQDGPVLLVGHSYGGAIITEAVNDPKVVGLVYVAAFAPSDGESVASISKPYPPTPIGNELRPDAQGFLRSTAICPAFNIGIQDSMYVEVDTYMSDGENPSTTLPGTVEKIIKPLFPGEPEKAQISVEGADHLYREIRIENNMIDADGETVSLRQGAEVNVTIEANPEDIIRRPPETLAVAKTPPATPLDIPA